MSQGAVAEAGRQPAGQMTRELGRGEHLGHPGAPAYGGGGADPVQHRIVAVPGGLGHRLHPVPAQVPAQRGEQGRLERVGADLGVLTGNGHGSTLGPAGGPGMNAGLPRCCVILDNDEQFSARVAQGPRRPPRG